MTRLCTHPRHWLPTGTVTEIAECCSEVVVWYGEFPDQQRDYFTLCDARRTLTMATCASGMEGSIYAGLELLANDLLAREWTRDDGAKLRTERCLIDANWGASTDADSQVFTARQ